MNNFSVLFFLSLLIASCSDGKEKEMSNHFNDSTMVDSTHAVEVVSANNTIAISEKPAYIKLDSINTQAITPLPVGSKLLWTYKFPKQWQSHGDEGFSPPEGINKVHKDAMDSVQAYYDRFHAGKSYLLPVINKLEYIKLNEKEDIPSDDSLVYSIKHCNYRFPDFGMYECYYTINSGRYVRTSEYQDFTHGEAGHLILYDRKKKCKILYDI